jgi:hypothetical protein
VTRTVPDRTPRRKFVFDSMVEVKHPSRRAQLGSVVDLRHHPVGGGFDESDAQQVGERHHRRKRGQISHRTTLLHPAAGSDPFRLVLCRVPPRRSERPDRD